MAEIPLGRFHFFAAKEVLEDPRTPKLATTLQVQGRDS